MTMIGRFVFPAAGLGMLALYFHEFGLPRLADQVAGAPTPMLAFMAFSAVIIGMLKVI